MAMIEISLDSLFAIVLISFLLGGVSVYLAQNSHTED